MYVVNVKIVFNRVLNNESECVLQKKRIPEVLVR